MKLKPGFDDEFQPKDSPGRCPSARSECSWSSLAPCGVIFAAVAARRREDYRSARSPLFPLQCQRPFSAPLRTSSHSWHQPRDPFVVMAAAEIDAKMVVAAPAGIRRGDGD